MDIWGVSYLLSLMSHAMTFPVCVFWVHGLSTLGNTSRSGIARSYGDLMFNIPKNYQTVFHSDCNILHLPPALPSCVVLPRWVGLLVNTIVPLGLQACGVPEQSWSGSRPAFAPAALSCLLPCFWGLCSPAPCHSGNTARSLRWPPLASAGLPLGVACCLLPRLQVFVLLHSQSSSTFTGPNT